LIRELKIQSFLAHVNLVKLYAFFHDRLNIYLLLEFCVSGQLYDLFRVKSKLREEEWQPLMKGVCEGLYELHRHGVIHRDLKPENIVLSFGIPKIGDFGWSVYSSTDKRETFCGTPLYISPELLLGNSYDRQVDIWALGVMMYEFLTGRIPFKIQHENNLL
jgi:aurora kinase, other